MILIYGSTLWGGMFPLSHRRCSGSESNQSEKAAYHSWCV